MPARRSLGEGGSIFSSVVFFHFGPGLPQISGESAAEENIEMLVAPRVRMFGMTCDFDALKMFAIAGPIATENDYDASIIIPRAPQPVALMIANRFRQTKPRTEEIDRARFTVIVRENRGVFLFLGRK